MSPKIFMTNSFTLLKKKKKGYILSVVHKEKNTACRQYAKTRIFGDDS